MSTVINRSIHAGSYATLISLAAINALKCAISQGSALRQKRTTSRMAVAIDAASKDCSASIGAWSLAIPLKIALTCLARLRSEFTVSVDSDLSILYANLSLKESL